MKKFAIYKCLKCYFDWKQKLEPTQCPKCGHLYVKWRNYTSFIVNIDEVK
jgi:DNA-directed RNA polymerase subunit RPC12/RpoP